jgi:hypothetical protein
MQAVRMIDRYAAGFEANQAAATKQARFGKSEAAPLAAVGACSGASQSPSLPDEGLRRRGSAHLGNKRAVIIS